MTKRIEELAKFRSLMDGGRVNFGNNAIGKTKGNGMITNGEFLIQKVTYVKGLQDNIISVLQLVVGTGLKGLFDDEGSQIIKKEIKSNASEIQKEGRDVYFEFESDQTKSFHFPI